LSSSASGVRSSQAWRFPLKEMEEISHPAVSGVLWAERDPLPEARGREWPPMLHGSVSMDEGLLRGRRVWNEARVVQTIKLPDLGQKNPAKRPGFYSSEFSGEYQRTGLPHAKAAEYFRCRRLPAAAFQYSPSSSKKKSSPSDSRARSPPYSRRVPRCPPFLEVFHDLNGAPVRMA